MEANYFPPTPALLTKKYKCKQIVCVTEWRGLSTLKYSYELHAVHSTILQKIKTMSINHTPTISITYTTRLVKKIPNTNLLYLENLNLMCG